MLLWPPETIILDPQQEFNTTDNAAPIFCLTVWRCGIISAAILIVSSVCRAVIWLLVLHRIDAVLWSKLVYTSGIRGQNFNA